MKKSNLLVLVIILIVLAACSGRAGVVRNGVLRDTIFSVEEIENGTWRIWVTHDDVAGYCTADEELGKEAMDLILEHDGEVLIFFETPLPGEAEYSFWHDSKCGDISTGYEESTAMFMVTGIQAVKSR